MTCIHCHKELYRGAYGQFYDIDEWKFGSYDCPESDKGDHEPEPEDAQ